MKYVAQLVTTFVFAFIAAAAWVRLIQSVNDNDALGAAFWDGVIYFSGVVVPMALWRESGFKFAVLLMGLLGSVAGTYAAFFV